MTRSVIEEDLTIEGNIASKDGDLEVKGRVNGDIDSRSVVVHAGGEVTGTISAESVRIQGRQSGHIKCTELALDDQAEVKADVTARTLTSEKGARLVGRIEITGA